MAETNPHQFGGSWTEKKLGALSAYLNAWINIFTKNRRATYFTKIYLDAFAGTGSFTPAQKEGAEPTLEDREVSEYLAGSTTVALSVPIGFDKYIFVERRPSYVEALQNLKSTYPERADKIEIYRDDANDFITRWVAETDWKKNRAVVFLDPYGMQIDWSTVEKLRRTNAVDLWVLIPVGIAVMRMLTNKGIPPDSWSEKLTRFFGSDEWKEEFYKGDDQPDFFDDPKVKKVATVTKITDYVVARLEGLFGEKAVAAPMFLYNDRGTLLYIFCFAASNEKGAPIAVRIANSIIGKDDGRNK